MNEGKKTKNECVREAQYSSKEKGNQRRVRGKGIRDKERGERRELKTSKIDVRGDIKNK